jgi:hypothetical protein
MVHEPSLLRVPPFSVQPSGTCEIVTVTRAPSVGRELNPRLMASPAMPAGSEVLTVEVPSTAPSLGFEMVTVTVLLFAFVSETPKDSVLSLGENVSVPELGLVTAVPEALQCTASVLSTLSPDDSPRLTV